MPKIKTKVVIIRIKHKIEGSGTITNIHFDGKLNKDMARFLIERIMEEVGEKPFFRWWEFWRRY